MNDIDQFLTKTKTVFSIIDPIGESELKCNCVCIDEAIDYFFGEENDRTN